MLHYHVTLFFLAKLSDSIDLEKKRKCYIFPRRIVVYLAERSDSIDSDRQTLLTF